jgi:hypothetical protein
LLIGGFNVCGLWKFTGFSAEISLVFWLIIFCEADERRCVSKYSEKLQGIVRSNEEKWR